MDRVSLGFDYLHVNGNVLVSEGQGVLHTITICGAPGTDGVATVYDNTDGSGTIIALLSISVADSISVQPITLTFDVEYETGLYIDYTGGLVVNLSVSFV